MTTLNGKVHDVPQERFRQWLYTLSLELRDPDKARVKVCCYRGNNRPFRVTYATITSMIAGLPLWLASRPRFSASWSFSGSVTCSP